MNIYVNARFLEQRITGVQRYAIEISRQLKMLSPDIKFVAPGNIVPDGLADELNIVAHGKMSGHLWEQLELPRFLKKRGNPLLINLGNTSPLHYKNKLVVIHDVAFMRNGQWFSKKFYFYYRFIVARAAREALKIITVSEFSKREICELINIPADKIEIVYGAAPNESRDGDGKAICESGRYILAVSSL
ncbi:MAG: glycosyltransferase, partial [Dissulfurispiraceae bacterium]